MNIQHIKNCFGCGVCAISCGKKIIDIRLNDDGFYEPYIAEPDKCTNCGQCVNACSYSHQELTQEATIIASYAAWSRDEMVLKKCSSGGVGFEVGRYLISQGYKVLGCQYNADKNRAEHYVASTLEELIPSIGSKYIQSYTLDGLRQIDRKQKYLITGTPCMIDSFRRYIQRFHCEDNFVLMDFFCHGVPSKLMWNKYVKWAEKKVGKLTYVSWRNKQTGLHDSWATAIDGEEHGEPVNWHDSFNMLIKGKKCHLNSRLSQGDMFYGLFLSNACLGKACYDKCRFKMEKSSADIRIGDAWGKTFSTNEEGVSAVIAFTQRGHDVLKESNCTLLETPFHIVAEGQMKTSPIYPDCYELLRRSLQIKKVSISKIYSIANPNSLRNRILRKMKNCISIIQRFSLYKLL